MLNPNYNPLVAFTCAQMSVAAYRQPNDIDRRCTDLGFPLVSHIDMSKWFEDLSAFLAVGTAFDVLCFRGTEKPRDWMDDLRSTPVDFSWLWPTLPELGQIHAGFGHALRDAWGQIIAEVIPNQMKPLYITGHSLGGALAALTGAVLAVSRATPRRVSGIYTFGQPRIGLHAFASNYDRLLGGKTFRFIQKSDLVPRVPFRAFDYADHSLMIHFGTDGVPRLESPEWEGFLGRAFNSFEEMSGMLLGLRMDVGDHSMDGYAASVQDNQDAIVALFNK